LPTTLLTRIDNQNNKKLKKLNSQKLSDTMKRWANELSDIAGRNVN
jgi:hypothetical protein